MPVHQVVELVADHIQYLGLQVAFVQDVMPVSVDDFPLLIQDIVVVQQMLAHVEVIAFYLHLGTSDGLGDQAVLDGNVVIQAGP